MTRPLAWVTGAQGLIGHYLVETAAQWAPGWVCRGLTRAEADLAQDAPIRRLFRREQPQLVIHCAAITSAMACEADPALAQQVNVHATACLAELAASIPLVFLSTDLVFDGVEGNYDETAKPNPLSFYASTKLAAERIVLANPGHTVIRTSLTGGVSLSGQRAFNEELRRAWREGRETPLFTDEFRSPIAAVVTARAVWETVGCHATGLYHLAGSERLSRFQIGQLVAARWPHLNPKLRAASLREYTGPPRAPDTSLNSAKIQRLLSFPLPGLTQWLQTQAPDEF